MNASFQALTVLTLLAHLAVLLSLGFSSGGARAMALLNAGVALVVLAYGATRARRIATGDDWPYMALLLVELLVLAAAIWSLRGNRPALIGSYFVFVLHGLVSVGAVLYAFFFKMKLF